MVSCAFSTLCVYSKFGHHPHPLGCLCVKFCFFHGLRCWASPLKKIAYSITHSTSLLDAPGPEAFASQKTAPANKINYTLILYAFHDLKPGNEASLMLTAPEPAWGYRPLNWYRCITQHPAMWRFIKLHRHQTGWVTNTENSSDWTDRLNHLSIGRSVAAASITRWEVDDVIGATDRLEDIRHTVTIDVACSGKVHLRKCPTNNPHTYDSFKGHFPVSPC